MFHNFAAFTIGCYATGNLIIMSCVFDGTWSIECLKIRGSRIAGIKILLEDASIIVYTILECFVTSVLVPLADVAKIFVDVFA